MENEGITAGSEKAKSVAVKNNHNQDWILVQSIREIIEERKKLR